MTLSSRRPHRCPAMAIIVIACLWAIPTAFAAQNGYCWNDKIGWVDMSGVTFTDSTRTFGGTATYVGGTFDGATFGPGEIDFGTQGNLSVTLSASTDGNGNYPLIGQAFSEQLGWIVPNHGGTEPAAMKTSGELIGNFWSNEFGWFNCSSSDVGAAHVQIWNPGNATSSSSAAVQITDSGGGGAGGGRRGNGGLPVQTQPTSSATAGVATAISSSLPSVRGFLSVAPNGGTSPLIFRDVPVSAWFAPYINFIVTNGIASGYTDAQGHPTGAFGPGDPVTYAQIAKIALVAGHHDIAGVSGIPKNRSARGQWSQAYVTLAEKLKFSVYTNAVNVNVPATRGAVIQTVVEALGIPMRGDGINPFSDLSASNAYAKAITTAASLGIISGDTDQHGKPTGKVRPMALITRAEVAKIVELALEAIRK